MRKLSNFFIVVLGGIFVFSLPQDATAGVRPTPTIFQQVLQVNVSPPYYPLAPCPSCMNPSVAPISNSPLLTPPPIHPTTAVSPNPCITGSATLAHDGGHRHHHKKHRGDVSKNMEKVLQFLLELINKLLALFGIQPITTPDQGINQPNVPDQDNDNNDNNNQQPNPCDGNQNQVPSPGVTTAPLPSINAPIISVVPAPSSVVPSVGEKYLIITDPTFSSALADFIAFRKNQGFDVFVATTDTTGKTTDSIKKFIQTRYDNTATRPKYLLLVGNVSFIPTWPIGEVRGDIPYAQLAGDVLPDLSVGRWPVTTAQHIANITKKTIAVETTPCPSKKEALFMASEDVKETTQPGQDQACTMMQSHGYTCNKSYPVPPGTTQQVIDAINRGQQFVWYIGHGEPEGWVEGPPVNNDDIAKLTNTVYPVVGSFTCNSCDLPNDAALNFCDAWIQATGGGAAFIGASWSTPWEEEVYFEHTMIKSMYQGIDRIGPMLDLAKKENFTKYSGEMGENYLNGYNLMGDPALKVPACP